MPTREDLEQALNYLDDLFKDKQKNGAYSIRKEARLKLIKIEKILKDIMEEV